MNEERIEKMVKEVEVLVFFQRSNRLPNAFYELSDEERAEVIKRYRERNGLDKHPPWRETK